MSNTEMLAAAEAFLDLVEKSECPAEERLGRLAEMLDCLALAYHSVVETEERYETLDELKQDYRAGYKSFSARFPELGYYPVASPKELPASPTSGNAIDDIFDIAYELRHVIWLWRNRSSQDAANHFRTSYRVHWGRHLFDLRSYLHAVLFDR